jgi:hypothetical protein
MTLSMTRMTPLVAMMSVAGRQKKGCSGMSSPDPPDWIHGPRDWLPIDFFGST